MSGRTFGEKSWYERTEAEANQGSNAFHSKTSGWQTEYEETECEDNASQYSAESYTGKGSVRYPSVGARLHTTFKKSLYTDVHFVISCGVKPKPSIYGHRAILAVGSSVFEDMFKKQEAAGQDLIQINNTPLHAFRSVVEYLYTDEVYFERDRDSQVMEVLAAAKAFKVPALEARCVSYLETSELSEMNVCSRLQLATTNKLEEHKKMCFQFIQDNTSAVIRSPDFIASDLSTVRNICKMPKLCLSSEVELFDGVMEWVKSQPDSRNKSKREVFDPLLKHIRFLSMSPLHFSRLVSSHTDLFTSEEALSIIVYLSKPAAHGKANLPSWCNNAGNRCISVLSAEHSIPRSNISSREKRVSIGLRPVKKANLPNLTCELALKCNGGRFKIKALRLSFGTPVTKDSTIQDLVISVYSEPNYYSFKEHHTMIQNTSDCLVPFTQTLLACRGNIIHIHAEALSAKNYNFLQFDEHKSFLEPSPFEFKLNSEPKGKQLFFISELIYEDLPPRRKPPTMFQTRH